MTYKPLPNAHNDGSDNGSSNNQRNDAPPDPGILPSPETRVASSSRSHIISNYFNHDSHQGRGWALLALMMIPNTGARCYEEAPWIAHLEVKSPDIARLMREGFFWSAENILPEEGFITREAKPSWARFGFCYKRTWVITDKSDDEVPRWVGYVEVLTPSREVVASFRVQDLTAEKVYAATVWNGLNQLVYDYHYQWPQKSFNCIYDDMPLQGWWPWPKEHQTFASSAVLGKGPNMEAESVTPRESEEFEEHKQFHLQLSTSCVIL